MRKAYTQYKEAVQTVLSDGTNVPNERTGKICRVVINHDMEYDVRGGVFPLPTERKCFWKQPIAELIGYLRGYNSAAQFRAIGCNTWNANANQTPAWVNNPNRKGTDDMGRVYGVQGRGWTNYKGETFDQFMKVYTDLKNGVDDRGEIITFWNPGEHDEGSLRPCMHTHTFSLVGKDLYLTSNQRSCDTGLGLAFNSVQCYTFLLIMAMLTGNFPQKAYHKIVNLHIYDDQLPAMAELVGRKSHPRNVDLRIKEGFTLDVLLHDPDVMDYFYIEGQYNNNGKLENEIPFAL